MAVSLRPSAAVATGLIGADGPVHIEITDAKFEYKEFDSGANTSLTLNFKDDDGNEFHEFYSVGNRVIPSDDGYSLKAAGDDPEADINLSNKSNYVKLVASLVNAGLNEAALDSGVNALVGVAGQAQRQVTGNKRPDGRDKTILLFVKLDEAKAKAAPAVKTAAVAKVASKPNGKAAELDVDAEAVTFLKTLIVEGKPFNVGKVANGAAGMIKAKAVGYLQKQPQFNSEARRLIVDKASSEEFLAGLAEGGELYYENSQLKLVAV